MFKKENDLNKVKEELETLQGWFYENHIIQNQGKYHYVLMDKDIVNETLHAKAEKKLLGIIIDKDLKFQSHSKSIIKTNQKLSALIRVASLMTDLNKKCNI